MNHQRRHEFLKALVMQDAWRSQEMQGLFLESLPELIALEDSKKDERSWWDSIRTGIPEAPLFVLRSVAIWIDDLISSFNPEDKNKFIFNKKEVNQPASLTLSELAKARPMEFTRTLLPRILKIIELTAEERKDDLVVDRTWHIRMASRFQDMNCNILEITIHAMEMLVKNRPDEFDEMTNPLLESRFESVVYLLLRVWMSYPQRYAPQVLSLLCSIPMSLKIGYSIWSGGEPTSAVSRAAIGKCLQYWSDAEVAQLESVILRYSPYPEAKAEHVDGCRHLLLSAIDISRFSPHGRETWKQLHEKFPNQELRLPSFDDTAEIVQSPIPPEITHNFTDAEWLEAISKYNTDRSNLRNPGGGTAVELSRVLETQVGLDPERFASLANRIPESIHPSYLLAILHGICPFNPSNDDFKINALALKRIIMRLHSQPERPFGKEISHGFAKLEKCEFEPSLLDVLEFYASEDPDPSHDTCIKVRQNGKDQDDFYSTGINTVRGTAVRSIGHVLYSHGDLLTRFYPVILKSVGDKCLSVRSCAIDALLPVLNFDKEIAVRLFLLCCDDADAILRTPPVERFHYYASRTHYDHLRPILLRGLGSQQEEAVQIAARQICLASFSVENAVGDARVVLAGSLTMRKAAAEIFSSNIQVPSCHDRCSSILSSLFSDESAEVRNIAARCWHGFTKEDLMNDVDLIQSYIESTTFPSGTDQLIHQLEETCAPLPEVILKMGKRFISEISAYSSDEAHPAAWESSMMSTLIVRLYSQSYDPTIRTDCLDLIDEMSKLGFDTENQLAKHDR